jgi:hypothetical protein
MSSATEIWVNEPRAIEQALIDLRAKYERFPAFHPYRTRLAAKIHQLEVELERRTAPNT